MHTNFPSLLPSAELEMLVCVTEGKKDPVFQLPFSALANQLSWISVCDDVNVTSCLVKYYSRLSLASFSSCTAINIANHFWVMHGATSCRQTFTPAVRMASVLSTPASANSAGFLSVLSTEELQRCVDTFVELQVEGSGNESWADLWRTRHHKTQFMLLYHWRSVVHNAPWQSAGTTNTSSHFSLHT